MGNTKLPHTNIITINISIPKDRLIKTLASIFNFFFVPMELLYINFCNFLLGANPYRQTCIFMVYPAPRSMLLLRNKFLAPSI